MRLVVPLQGERHLARLAPIGLRAKGLLEVDPALDHPLQEHLQAPPLLGLLQAAPRVGQGEGVEHDRLRVREGLGGEDIRAEGGEAARDAGEEVPPVRRHHHEPPEGALAGEGGNGGAAAQAGHEREVLDDLHRRGGGQVVAGKAEDEPGEALPVHGERDAVQEGPYLALVGDREVPEGGHGGWFHPGRVPVK